MPALIYGVWMGARTSNMKHLLTVERLDRCIRLGPVDETFNEVGGLGSLFWSVKCNKIWNANLAALFEAKFEGSFSEFLNV